MSRREDRATSALPTLRPPVQLRRGALVAVGTSRRLIQGLRRPRCLPRQLSRVSVEIGVERLARTDELDARSAAGSEVYDVRVDGVIAGQIREREVELYNGSPRGHRGQPHECPTPADVRDVPRGIWPTSLANDCVQVGVETWIGRRPI